LWQKERHFSRQLAGEQMKTDLASEPLDVMDRKNHAAYNSIAGGVCLCVLGIILTAGLWPFRVPTNQVRWLKSEHGLEFGRHGCVVTSGAIRGSERPDALATLEIWLEPASSQRSSTILSFDGSTHPGEPFSLHQQGDALSIRRNNVDPHGVSRTALCHVDGVFQKNKPVFVTITLDSKGTAVYVNGVLAEVSPLSGTWNDLTGRAVLANSPAANDSWAGKIFGLAIYQKELTAAQVAQHYESWTITQKPDITYDEAPVALYLLNERVGKIIHNQLGAAPDILLPTHYFVLHPPFLAPAWRLYRYGWPGWRYWEDVLVNVLGFVPVGFFLLNYLALARPNKRLAAIVILLGFFLSLTIESLQWFLPTRDSDMTDLISNTLGTAVGVTLYRCSRVHGVWGRLTGYSLGVLVKRQTH
jgi:hypothetical protein